MAKGIAAQSSVGVGKFINVGEGFSFEEQGVGLAWSGGLGLGKEIGGLGVVATGEGGMRLIVRRGRLWVLGGGCKQASGDERSAKRQMESRGQTVTS